MFTLYYHGGWYGRSAPIIAALETAGKKKGVDYVVKDPSETPENTGFAVPILTFPSGVTIGQSGPIMEALGEELGLMPSSAEDKLLAKQYIADCADIFSELFGGKLNDNSERSKKWFSFIESKIKGKYFFGDDITVVDFCAYFTFLWVEHKKVDISGYPTLSAWYASIKETPSIVAIVNDDEVPLIPPGY